MKKFFIFLFVLIIVAIVGAAIFLMTLDLDKFRPQIVDQIENAIHKPVTLDKLRLGWQSGLALELQGFSILKSEEDPQPLLKVGSAKAVLELVPLLARELQIAAIRLDRPAIYLVKKQDGTFEGLEPAAAQQSEEKKSGTPPKEAAGLAFLVNTIQLRDGEVFYKDESEAAPMEVALRKIDITINDVALDRPIDIKGKAAVFNNSQNFDINGKLTVSSRDKTATVNGLHAELKLDPMDFNEIAKVSPAVQESGITPPVNGTLTVDVDSAKLDEKGMEDIAAKIVFSRGKVQLDALKDPIENISLNVLAAMTNIDVQKFSANVAGGTAEGTAKVLLTNPTLPITTFDLKAGGIEVEQLIPVSKPSDPEIKGVLSLDVKGQLTGSAPEVIKQSLNADGKVVIEQTEITNKNVLREIFDKLSIIPGLVEKLLSRLPENYKQKLEAKGTKLGTVQLPFSASNGIANLPKIDVATESFRITGSATYGLQQGMVNGNAVIAIEPDLSGALARSVEELRYLMNSNNEVQIPLTFRGVAPRIIVVPDLKYIGSQIAAAEATKYIRKAIGVKDAPEGTEGTGSSTGGGSVLDVLLQEGLNKLAKKTNT